MSEKKLFEKGNIFFHINAKTDDISRLEVMEIREDGFYVVKDVTPSAELLEDRLKMSKEVVGLLSNEIDQNIKKAIAQSFAERYNLKELSEMKANIEKTEPEQIKIKGGKKHCLWVKVGKREITL